MALDLTSAESRIRTAFRLFDEWKTLRATMVAQDRAAAEWDSVRELLTAPFEKPTESIFPIYQPNKVRVKVQNQIWSVLRALQIEDVASALRRKPKEHDLWTTGWAPRFFAYTFPFAGQWRHVHTRKAHLVLSDNIFRDEAGKISGIGMSVPSSCGICRTAITESPTERHGVRCGYKDGGNRQAGSEIENAVRLALQSLGEKVSKSPKLGDDLGIDMDNEDAVGFGDIRSTAIDGRTVVIDCVFASKINCSHKRPRATETACKAEKRKRRNYENKATILEGTFVPFGVDACGVWSTAMTEYMLASNEKRKQRIRELGIQHDQQWRAAKELISVGVCRANAIYMERVRVGYTPWRRSERAGNQVQPPQIGDGVETTTNSNPGGIPVVSPSLPSSSASALVISSSSSTHGTSAVVELRNTLSYRGL